MASYTLTSITTSSVTVYVSGISSGQSIEIYIRLDPGSAADKVFDETYTSTGTHLIKTCSGLPDGTNFAINVKYQGDWIGAQTFSTKTQAAPTRPRDWQWTSTVSAGSPIRISAAEWNNFCSRINEFRRYKSLSNYSFTTVYSGTPISATIVNQAVSAIKGISGYGSYLYYVSPGNAITAYFFNLLKTELNAI